MNNAAFLTEPEDLLTDDEIIGELRNELLNARHKSANFKPDPAFFERMLEEIQQERLQAKKRPNFSCAVVEWVRVPTKKTAKERWQTGQAKYKWQRPIVAAVKKIIGG